MYSAGSSTRSRSATGRSASTWRTSTPSCWSCSTRSAMSLIAAAVRDPVGEFGSVGPGIVEKCCDSGVPGLPGLFLPPPVGQLRPGLGPGSGAGSGSAWRSVEQGGSFGQPEWVGRVGCDRFVVDRRVFEDGVDDGEVVEVEPVGEPAGLPDLLRRGHCRDQGCGFAEGVDPVFDEVVAVGPAVGDLVDDEVGERAAVVQRCRERVRARGWRAVPPRPSRRRR